MGLFIQQAFENPEYFILATIAVVFSICFHEFSHAWIALQFGDSTAAERGHLTLNPLRQMGWLSIVMLLILGIAWGAVPVNAARLRAKSRWAYPLVSLAGPAANLLLFLLAWIAFGLIQPRIPLIIEDPDSGVRLLTFLFVLGTMNGVLCLFNLLPIPGLDGWNVLGEFVPRLLQPSTEWAKGVMMFTIFVMILFIGRLYKFFGDAMLLAPDALSFL